MINDQFGGADAGGGATGRCNPAESLWQGIPAFPTWPAMARAWDDGYSDEGAILLTAASFGCNQWGPAEDGGAK